jgi:hypothetical protein
VHGRVQSERVIKELVSVSSGGLMNVDLSNLRMALKLGKLIKMLDLW